MNRRKLGELLGIVQFQRLTDVAQQMASKIPMKGKEGFRWKLGEFLRIA